ncbi:MAG: phosphopentomutase [Candidatus Zixiibacteriota bacterium]|nr:MAG: phosphopentomutase [candidate division Zixibacteria bacterium]
MSHGRVILIIIDACGVGELPDADQYGDSGSATLPNIARAVAGLDMPTCQKLGLGNIVPIKGLPPAEKPLACFGKMAEKSAGKDSTTGHWEIGGIIMEKPFPLFPRGFPAELVDEFQQRAAVTVIGNLAASGTEIIKQLGERQLQTGEIILYTSADSVFQLAAHEDIFPLDRLYEICAIAREILTGEFAVARVIARPFTGQPGSFVRTAGRKDFSLQPPSDTILDLMIAGGFETLAVGKTYDLFAERGFTSRMEAKSNAEILEEMIHATKSDTRHSLIFGNCVDFDMLWGHRNDTESFAEGLEQFDRHAAELLKVLNEDDLLIITADHGCDPTIKSSTDHTREYVPLLVHGKDISHGVNLGTRATFADIACSIAHFFDLNHQLPGTSFMGSIVRR